MVSSPHSGTQFPVEMRETFRESFVESPPDTDWFIDQLYDFVPELGVTLITASYSRYVIDLNRDPSSASLYNDGRTETGLVPLQSFSGEKIYRKQNPSDEEIQRRLEQYYWPYHHQLQSLLEGLRDEYGAALLFDAHSIRQTVKSIQEEPFPDLIVGNQNQKTCDPLIHKALFQTLYESPEGYSVSDNHPFKGGQITRSFGRPSEGIHSIQLEMSQTVYMDEEKVVYLPEKAEAIRGRLKEAFLRLIDVMEQLK